MRKYITFIAVQTALLLFFGFYFLFLKHNLSTSMQMRVFDIFFLSQGVFLFVIFHFQKKLEKKLWRERQYDEAV